MTRIRPRPAGFRYRSQLAAPSPAAAGGTGPTGRPPHAVPPDQDEAVPVPGQPPPGDPEPAGGDLTAEPRPRVVVALLAGYLGRAGVPPGRGERHDRRPEPAPRPQDHDLVGIA